MSIGRPESVGCGSTLSEPTTSAGSSRPELPLCATAAGPDRAICADRGPERENQLRPHGTREMVSAMRSHRMGWPGALYGGVGDCDGVRGSVGPVVERASARSGRNSRGASEPSRLVASTACHRIVFASNLVGSGRDWPITTGVSDEDSLALLRSIQVKVTRDVRGLIGAALGTRAK